VVGQIIRSGSPLFADDSKTHPQFRSSNFVEREGVCSSAGIPLKVGEETVGILLSNYCQPHPFSEDEKKGVLLFSNQAAIAILDARLFDAVEKKRRHLQAVYEAGKIITAASVGLRRKEILRQFLEQAVALTAEVGSKATVGTIHIFEEGLILNV